MLELTLKFNDITELDAFVARQKEYVAEYKQTKLDKKVAKPELEEKEVQSNDTFDTSDLVVEEPPKPTQPALDFDKDIKPAAVKCMQEKGRDVYIAVLKTFGIENATAIKNQPEKYTAFHTALVE